MSEAQLLPSTVRKAADLRESLLAESIYVNGTTGSDAAGTTGTAADPFATPKRAYEEKIPFIVKDKLQILVAEDSYGAGSWPESIYNFYKDGGSLSIIGVGAPTVVSGPWTVTGVAALGGGGHEVTIGAGGLGADDSLCGQTIVVATGSTPNKAFTVIANTDTTLIVAVNSAPIQNGDTLNLVTPSTTFVAEKCSIKYEAANNIVWDGGLYTARNACLTIHNLTLDFSATTTAVDFFQIQGGQGKAGPYFDFVRVITPDSNFAGVTFRDTVLPSTIKSYDETYGTDGGTGIVNLDDPYGRPGITFSSAGARSKPVINAYGNVVLSFLTVKGGISAIGFASLLYMSRCGAGTVAFTDCRGVFSLGVVQGYAGADAVYADHSAIELDTMHISVATNALKMRTCSTARLEAASCTTASVSGSAALIGACCNIRQEKALASFVGSSGTAAAYSFYAPAAPVVSNTWLAVDGTSDTDAMGAYVTRQDG